VPLQTSGQSRPIVLVTFRVCRVNLGLYCRSNRSKSVKYFSLNQNWQNVINPSYREPKIGTISKHQQRFVVKYSQLNSRHYPGVKKDTRVGCLRAEVWTGASHCRVLTVLPWFFGAKQLTGGLFNDALYEGEDGCEQDNVLRATLTMSRVRNFARNARIVRAILLE